MTRNTEIARAVRHALVMGTVTVAAATSLPAAAQTQAQTTDQETTPLATVVVTDPRRLGAAAVGRARGRGAHLGHHLCLPYGR